MKIAITQPYVPDYRLRMWRLVMDSLEEQGFSVRLFTGMSASEASESASREDRTNPRWAEEVRTSCFPTTRRFPPLRFRHIPGEWRSAVLLTEMQVTNMNAWYAASNRVPFITLGHGYSAVSEEPLVSKSLESRLNRAALGVLTYTDAGRREVIRRTRLSSHRVRSFENTVDTASLKAARDAISSQSSADFLRANRIPPDAKIALTLSSLSDGKRIDLLADAARAVFARDTSWWLLVAGDGPLRNVLERLAAESGRVVMLGRTDIRNTAQAAAVSRVILNPGRIGLVAVDALTLGLPVLTSAGARHAPEVDYLDEGETLFVSGAEPVSFAESWLSIPDETGRFGIAPTIERSAERISEFLTERIRTHVSSGKTRRLFA